MTSAQWRPRPASEKNSPPQKQEAGPPFPALGFRRPHRKGWGIEANRRATVYRDAMRIVIAWPIL
jgi:hypothetical protein